MLSSLDKHGVWSDARAAHSASETCWPAPASASASAPVTASTDTAHRPRSDPTDATSGNASDGSSTQRDVVSSLPVDAVEDGANLFVAGLPPSVDDEALERHFAKFGEVLSAKVMLHVDTAVSRGFGFVLFRHAADAAKARSAMHGHAIEGHAAGERLTVSVSRHKGENLGAESRVVYVRNVPVCISRERLTEVFGEYGEVAKLQVKATRALPGDAHGDFEPHPSATLANIVVEFATPSAARRCVAKAHNKRVFSECQLPLLAKIEEPHELRDKRRNERLAAAAAAKEAMLRQPLPSVRLPAAPKPPGVPAGSDPQTTVSTEHTALATQGRAPPATASAQRNASGAVNRSPEPNATGAPWPYAAPHAYGGGHLYHYQHPHSAYAQYAPWPPPHPPTAGAFPHHPPGGPSPTPGPLPQFSGYPPHAHAYHHAWPPAPQGAYTAHPPAGGHVVTHVYYGGAPGYPQGY